MLSVMGNRHMIVMAYSDVFWMLGMLFVVGQQFLMLLGGRPSISAPTPVPPQAAMAEREIGRAHV